MDRRLLNFVVLSGAFFLCFTLLRIQFGIPPAQQAANKNAAAQNANADADGNADAPDGEAQEDSNASPDDNDADDSVTDTDASPKNVGKNTDNADDADPNSDTDSPATKTPVRWATLGSMDPQSKFHLLITICNQGGAIERAELTARDKDGNLEYRRVDVRHGYLGYLASSLDENVDGSRVNVVAPGTPAALATAETGETGLQVGDVILSVDAVTVTTPDDLEQSLRQTLPGDEIAIEVLRKTTNSNEADEDAAQTTEKTLRFTAKLTHHPLDLVRLARDGGDDQIVGNLSRLSGMMTVSQFNRKKILASERWIAALGDHSDWVWSINSKDLADGEHAVELSYALKGKSVERAGGEPVLLSRSFRLAPSSYSVDMSLDVKNLGDKPQDLAYRLEGPNGLTLEGWWYSNKISPNWTGTAARDLVYKTEGRGGRVIGGYELLKNARKKPKDADQRIFATDDSADDRAVHYIGMDAQYFVVAYLPPEGTQSFDGLLRASAGIVADESQIEKHKERAINTTFYLDSEIDTVPPGESIHQDLRLFVGPKVPEVAEANGLGDTVYYGWFSLIAKPLASLLHLLYWVVGNYGLAIIILTIIVRGAMFPLSRKAAVNAQKMQELAPELKKIAEQYKDDMEGRLKAQRELQQRVGFNPMAGCLPMFLQLPIFIGLYRALSVDIDLRQAPLFSFSQWASNLGAPDQLHFWGDWMPDFIAGRGSGWLGPYFNVLPIIVVVLFLVQQKMFMPPATDEQTAMTQKVMTFMTMFMGVLFFKVPAGLCIYFISSSIWGICERIIVKKTLPQGKHFDQNVIDGAATKTAKKESKSSIADRLRQQMGQAEEPPPQRPNKRRRPPIKKKR